MDNQIKLLINKGDKVINYVCLIGRLTEDAYRSETLSGIAVCHFTIAVNRATSSNGEKKADFFTITAWRGLADSVSRYCKKGSKVCVTGSIQLREYEDNKGVKKNAVDVMAQDIEFL